MSETITEIEHLITRMTNDLQTGYDAPGMTRPDTVAHIAAAIESLANAREILLGSENR